MDDSDDVARRGVDGSGGVKSVGFVVGGDDAA